MDLTTGNNSRRNISAQQYQLMRSIWNDTEGILEPQRHIPQSQISRPQISLSPIPMPQIPRQQIPLSHIPQSQIPNQLQSVRGVTSEQDYHNAFDRSYIVPGREYDRYPVTQQFFTNLNQPEPFTDSVFQQPIPAVPQTNVLIRNNNTGVPETSLRAGVNVSNQFPTGVPLCQRSMRSQASCSRMNPHSVDCMLNKYILYQKHNEILLRHADVLWLQDTINRPNFGPMRHISTSSFCGRNPSRQGLNRTFGNRTLYIPTIPSELVLTSPNLSGGNNNFLLEHNPYQISHWIPATSSVSSYGTIYSCHKHCPTVTLHHVPHTNVCASCVLGYPPLAAGVAATYNPMPPQFTSTANASSTSSTPSMINPANLSNMPNVNTGFNVGQDNIPQPAIAPPTAKQRKVRRTTKSAASTSK